MKIGSNFFGARVLYIKEVRFTVRLNDISGDKRLCALEWSVLIAPVAMTLRCIVDGKLRD